jgi:hypothetical protein
MSETIGLGGRRFEIRPLKLGQLRHLLDALEEMTGKSGGGLIDAAAKVVAVGLQPAHPDLGAEAVLDLEAGIDELNAAVAAILRTAGLQPAERLSGEGEPVASPGTVPGSSSAPSTAPSPPAAATPTG